MGKKGGANFASLVGWSGGFLIFSAFLIWALDDGVYSWLQYPLPSTGELQSVDHSGLPSTGELQSVDHSGLPSTGELQSVDHSGLFRNFSITQDRQHDRGVSSEKPESNTGEEYIAKNVTGTLSNQDVNGSSPATGNKSANLVPIRGGNTNMSMAEPSGKYESNTGEEYIAKNVTGTLSNQDVNGSSLANGNRSANHVPIRGGNTNMSMAESSGKYESNTREEYIAKNVTGAISNQDVDGSSPATGNRSANHVPIRGGNTNMSMAESSGKHESNSGEKYIAKNVTGAPLHQDINGSNPAISNRTANDALMRGRIANISLVKPSSPSAGMQRQCDLFKGKWVYDKSYVLYLPGSCPYASIDFNCRLNGRMDSDYERWRWQPQDCDLPRFNASRMLERLRDKRLLFVGDSINRNQWESMLCLLRAVVPEHEITHRFDNNGKFIQYIFKAYNCSVELSWAPFLVRQHQRATNGSVIKETLQLDSIHEQAKRWKNADVLVFNTGHWWTHEEPYNGVDYFEERGRVIPHMEELVAFEKALRTWARWIDSNINPKHTQVFFRGYSPVHFHGQAWGKKVGGGCFRETEPIHVKIEKKIEMIYGERKRMQIVEKVVTETRRKKVRVKLLDVTRLSMYRKDAHVSVYTSKIKNMKNENDYSMVDCSHWCLPGLPDVWNNFLYALVT